ncbi:FtsX-like permease family protein [uncultured Paraglaciecola sp.]|jgi:putative ABC transport system permease protein|uniref:ABC transporter permease n=1 Tax=uncultured Paraglaciecola sp. TaxID=1765024 RepID=UPI0026392798|nr:ABC transporter permease [uncultured Paraglaciecola sp.]
MLMSLAVSSLKNRRKSILLTFFSLLISISVLLGVEHIRQQAKESFSRTVSGVDLIVGAPSGQLNLLLYSVFRMGSPTNNINYKSFQVLRNNQQVEWAIPISLGDSHHGFRVIGTTQDYFTHFRYGKKQPLEFVQGQAFSSLFEVVIGIDVAKEHNYQVGDEIVVAHGVGSVSFKHHDETPFVVSGILKPTGTPVDKSLHITLEAIEAIHLSPAKLRQLINDEDAVDLSPNNVTAVMLGLKSKFATFTLQRNINSFPDDRLMAILPGVAMSELWSMMANFEILLRVISILVLFASLFGLSTMLLASMDQRKSEIAVLRVLGAGPSLIFSLVLIEALMLVSVAIIASVMTISLTLTLLGDWLASEYGLFLSANLLSMEALMAIGIILFASIITSTIPAFEAYRNALHSTLSAR